MSTEQGHQFTSSKWDSFLSASNVKKKRSLIESHDGLELGEWYLPFSRRVYIKVRASSPGLSHNDALKFIVKEGNYTPGPTGVLSTPHVFGISLELDF